MDKETPLEQFAQETARNILRRYAPDSLDRPGLLNAIARLAHLELESSVRLFQIQQQPSPEHETDRPARQKNHPLPILDFTHEARKSPMTRPSPSRPPDNHPNRQQNEEKTHV